MTKNFLLDIQKNKDGQICGSVHDLLPDEKHTFTGMDKAISLMGETMKQNLRGFENSGKKSIRSCREADRPGTQPGKNARFHVRVLYQEQNTWQGELTWIEKGEKMRFRSVLELLNMIDSAFGKALEEQAAEREKK